MKLLNEKGEFINAQDGAEVIGIADQDAYSFAEVDDLGSYTQDVACKKHIQEILDLLW